MFLILVRQDRYAGRKISDHTLFFNILNFFEIFLLNARSIVSHILLLVILGVYMQHTQSDISNRLSWALLALRASIFIVMFVWTLDKFVNPAHGMKIFEHFYGISGLAETAV